MAWHGGGATRKGRIGEPESGHCDWFIDREGNMVEFWEPEKMGA